MIVYINGCIGAGKTYFLDSINAKEGELVIHTEPIEMMSKYLTKGTPNAIIVMQLRLIMHHIDIAYKAIADLSKGVIHMVESSPEVNRGYFLMEGYSKDQVFMYEVLYNHLKSMLMNIPKSYIMLDTKPEECKANTVLRDRVYERFITLGRLSDVYQMVKGCHEYDFFSNKDNAIEHLGLLVSLSPYFIAF